MIRLAETAGSLTTSPAFACISALGNEALKRVGQSFWPDGRHIGITPVLPRMVRQAGFEQVRLRATTIEWSRGTEMHDPVFKDALIGLELVQPFLVQMGVATREEGRRSE